MGKRKYSQLITSLKQESKAKKHKSTSTPNHSTPAHKTSKALIPFSQRDRILFVGEGNFSFSASCVENHLEHGSDVTSTSLDSLATVLSKYPDAQDHLNTIVDCCGTVEHGIDATKLHKYYKTIFDVVLFCFPHVAAGIADEARNVKTNQDLLLAFFESVQSVLTPRGTVAVALACNKTYDLWNLKGLAKSTGLVVKTSGVFDGKAFPGYTHSRTQGHVKNDAGFSGGKGEERAARWTIFMKPETQGQNTKKARSKVDSHDDE